MRIAAKVLEHALDLNGDIVPIEIVAKHDPGKLGRSSETVERKTVIAMACPVRLSSGPILAHSREAEYGPPRTGVVVERRKAHALQRRGTKV